jgi:hypothetical protein
MNATRLAQIKEFALFEESAPWDYADDTTSRKDDILKLISEIERLQTVAKILLEGCKTGLARIVIRTCIRKGEEALRG